MVSISLTSSSSNVGTGEVFTLTATLNPNPGSGYTVVFMDTGAFPDTEIFRGTTNAQGQVNFDARIGTGGTYRVQAVYYSLGPNIPCILSGCIYSNELSQYVMGNDLGYGIKPKTPNPDPVYDYTQYLIIGGVLLAAYLLISGRR